MSFVYMDTFKPVKPRKQRGTRSPRQLLDDTTVALGVDGWLARVTHDIHAFFGSDEDVIERALCLGLGCPSSAGPARAQLALLLSVCDALQIDRTRISLYDPVFAAADHDLLTSLGTTVLPTEQFGVKGRTLVFMPHCELVLYERFLRANWASSTLHQVLLLGNDLREYATTRPLHDLAQKYPCIHALASHLRTQVLATPPSAFIAAFNNTACQAVLPSLVLPPLLIEEDNPGESKRDEDR